MEPHKKKRVFTFFIFLLITAVAMFVECDVYFPDKIKVFYGENLEVRQGSPYSVQVSATGTMEANEAYNAQVKLFGIIPVKKVEIGVLPTSSIVPGGKTVGIKLFTQGLMCVGTEQLKSEDGSHVDVAGRADIKSADIILSANQTKLNTVEQLGKIVTDSGGNPITLLIERDGEQREKNVTPVKTREGYKLGIWVRDSTAGIGTVTFVDPESGAYGALGHPITDVDTGTLMPVEEGSISAASVASVRKGKRGEPGELCGLFDQSGTDKGIILKNTRRGIYGVLDPSYPVGVSDTALPVASKSKVQTGKAEIYANVEDDKVEAFEVEIVKIMKYAVDDKNMIIHVTDKRLIDKTGGIVQGMSGSPIVQNGKLIGAVTHVLVNDPTKGYGIFIENMLTEAEKIK